MNLRRPFVLAVALIFLPTSPATDAQQPAKVPRVGYLRLGAWPAPFYGAFWQEMRELGYVDHKDIAIDKRDAAGDYALLDDLAAELVRLKVDVIVAESTAAALAAKSATRTIPIVAIASDPVGSGLVASLTRPGQNITGLAFLSPEVSAKRLELLKEAAPAIFRVAILWESADPPYLREARVAARALGLELLPVEVEGPGERDLERAFAAVTRGRADALIITMSTDPLGYPPVRRVVDFAAKNRLPAMYSWREFVDAGGLVSYGLSFADLSRRAAALAERTLKGAKPADLPVEQPTRFELVINLKTAKALGLTIPQSILIRADEVIQ